MRSCDLGLGRRWHARIWMTHIHGEPASITKASATMNARRLHGAMVTFTSPESHLVSLLNASKKNTPPALTRARERECTILVSHFLSSHYLCFAAVILLLARPPAMLIGWRCKHRITREREKIGIGIGKKVNSMDSLARASTTAVALEPCNFFTNVTHLDWLLLIL